MSSTLQVGGLVSGLDTTTLIDNLVAIEQTRVTREEKRKDTVQKTSDTFDELSSRITNLASKADSLNTDDAFDVFKTTSNDEDIVTLSGDTDAIAGSYEIEVQSLASTQKVASKAYSSITSALGMSGTFEVTTSAAALKSDPTKTSVSIKINSNDSLKDVAARINAADGVGVRASILSLATGESRLVLTSVDSGTESFYMKDVSGNLLSSSGLGVLEDATASRSQFSFLAASGGAATEDTTFGEISTGIGINNLDSGDAIKITGTDASGNEISSSFTIDPSTSTIGDLLTQIQDAFGEDTKVSLNSSGEIVLTNAGEGTGQPSLTLSLQDQGASSSIALGTTKQKNVFSNVVTEGRKAFYTLDGMAVGAQSNSDSKTVMGTTINLHKAEPGQVVQVSLERDLDTVASKIKAFVDEYNSVIQYIDDKSKVTITEETDSESTTGAKKKVATNGPLTSESFVDRIKSQLQSIMTSSIKELEGKTQYTSLSRLGITTSRDTGKLEVDDDKLKEALETDFEGVRRLFIASGWSDNPNQELGRYTKDTKTGTYTVDADNNTIDSTSSSGTPKTADRISDILTSTKGDSKGLTVRAASGSGSGEFTFVRGIASQLRLYVNDCNDYVDGSFKQYKESINKRIEAIEDRIDKLDDQVSSYRDRLTVQFAALEQSMQRLQQQSSSFTSALG